MTQEDYPALHGDAERASATAQARFYRALAWSLLFLVLAAILSLAGLAKSWFAILQVLAILMSLALSLYLALVQPQRVWYGTRALAESIKTVSWRYMMKAEPYDTVDAESRELFVGTLEKILSDNDVSEHAIAQTAGSQISRRMQDCRARLLADRRNTYDLERIGDQLQWYRAKANFNVRRSKQWFALLLVVQVLAILASVCRVAWPEWPYWPTDVFISIAGAAIAWLQTKRFQELSGSYSLTAHEIGLLREKLADARTEQDFSEFVGDAENAFSREHTQWRARRDAA